MDKSTLSSLRAGYCLKGSAYAYHIEKVLGQGSFGITYLATTKASITGPLGNIETEIKVAVKEFFMKEFSSRHEDGTITEMTGGSLVSNYAKKFRKEAENLAKLHHPNIVNVLEVFDANNTCYYSMQYMEGGSLDEYVSIKGGLPENEAKECIRQIGEAVSYMHDHKMLHLDLKPSNVMRSGDGSRMVLIDFGLSKQYEENGIPESSTTIGLGTPGYAPLEQSSSDREKDFAPTLDVYALGATFYKLMTGRTPPRATDLYEAVFDGDDLVKKHLLSIDISDETAIACSKAMAPAKRRRFQTVSEFINSIDCKPVISEIVDDFLLLDISSRSIDAYGVVEGGYLFLDKANCEHVLDSFISHPEVNSNQLIESLSSEFSSLKRRCEAKCLCTFAKCLVAHLNALDYVHIILIYEALKRVGLHPKRFLSRTSAVTLKENAEHKEQRNILVADMEKGCFGEFSSIGDGVAECSALYGKNASGKGWFVILGPNEDKRSLSYDIFKHISDFWQDIDNVIFIAERMPIVPLTEFRGLQLSAEYMQGLYYQHEVLVGRRNDILLLDVFRGQLAIVPDMFATTEWSSNMELLLPFDDMMIPTRHSVRRSNNDKASYFVLYRSQTQNDWRNAVKVARIVLAPDFCDITLDIDANSRVTIIASRNETEQKVFPIDADSLVKCNDEITSMNDWI